MPETDSSKEGNGAQDDICSNHARAICSVRMSSKMKVNLMNRTTNHDRLSAWITRMLMAVRTIPFKAIVADVESGRGISGCISRAMLLAPFAIAAVYAARWVGYLVGWLVGASESPVAGAIIPGVIGLVAAIGLRSKRLRLRTQAEIIAATFLAILVIVICDQCFWGIADGVEIRTRR